MNLADLDNRLSYLQSSVLEPSSKGSYAIGARDYLHFGLLQHLPLDPTPLTLARYIVFMSQRNASGPDYLPGVRHFLHDGYPDFDTNRAHPLVKSAIRGSRKIRVDPCVTKIPFALHILKLSPTFHAYRIIGRPPVLCSPPHRGTGATNC